MRLLNKACAAFTFSCEKLFSEHEKVYFWTFTFKDVPPDDFMAMESWHTLAARLGRCFPDMQGLRVCELHKSHGIHFHCLVNIRIPVDRMKKICFGNGRLFGKNHYLDFGRLTVKKANIGAAGYLAKYMTKEYCTENNFWHRRRWGTMGGFEHVPVKNIEFDSEATRNRRKLYGNLKCSYSAMMMIHHATVLFGPIEEWPSKYISLCFNQVCSIHDWLREGRAWVIQAKRENLESYENVLSERNRRKVDYVQGTDEGCEVEGAGCVLDGSIDGADAVSASENYPF